MEEQNAVEIEKISLHGFEQATDMAQLKNDRVKRRLNAVFVEFLKLQRRYI